MAHNEILSLIKDAFQHVEGKDASSVSWTLDARFAEIGISSVTAVEMAGYLEEHLDVELSDAELARAVTVGDLIALLERASLPKETLS